MPTHRKGLTLIEVLIIIVMIGILLTIVIQKIGGKPNKELISALQTNVHNARIAENRYFKDHNEFGTLTQLDALFRPIPGTTVTIALTASGYIVTTNNGTNPMTCTLTVAGTAPADPVCK